MMKSSRDPNKRSGAPSHPPRSSQAALQDGQPQLWQLTHAEKLAAATSLLLSLIARIPAFSLGYSVDDYAHVLVPQGFDFAFSLSQGRPLVTPLLQGLLALGLHPAQIMSLSTLSLIAALLFAGLVVCRLMGISGNPLACTAVLATLSLHPYQAEIFTFRTASLLMAIPLMLAFGAMLVPGNRLWQRAVAVLVVAAALSIYQTAAQYMLLAILLAALSSLLSSGWNEAWAVVRPRIFLLAASLALYAATIAALSAFFGIPMSSRAGLLPLAEWPLRTIQIAVMFKRIFFEAEPVAPLAYKILLIACLLLAAWAVAAPELSKSRSHAIRRLAWFVTATALAALAAPGVILLLRQWWPAPRVLSHYGLFWGAVLALGLHFARPPLRSVLAAAAGLALFFMTGLSNRIAAEQLRVNQRDRVQAALILAAVDRMPGAESLQGVWLQGGSPFYPLGIHTVSFDLNVSALSTAWAKTWLLNEVSGRNYSVPDNSVVAEAARRCSNAPRFPADGAILRIGGYAVVCLPGP